MYAIINFSILSTVKYLSKIYKSKMNEIYNFLFNNEICVTRWNVCDQSLQKDIQEYQHKHIT